MKPLHLVVLILVAVAVMLGITMMKKQQEKSAPPPVAASSGPPSSATFLEPDVSPLDAVSAGNAVVGYWIKEPGWQVAIKQITKSSDGGKALRIEISQPSTLRGSAWLVAIVPEDTEIKENEFVMLSGRIAEAKEFNDGGPVPGHSLVIRDVKLKK